jgi:exopolysaccharide biosynthesis polyprenyl glycosylphosphotransferase
MSMLKEHDAFFRKLLIVGDLLLIDIAFFLSYYLRNRFFFFYTEEFRELYSLGTYVSQLPLLLAVCGVMLSLSGAYQPLRGQSRFEILKNITQAVLISLAAYASLAYLFKFHFLSRTFIVLIFAISWVFLCAQRLFLIYALKEIRKRGLNTHNILIVGTGSRAQNFIRYLQKHPDLGFQIVGLVDPDPALQHKDVMGYKVIGVLEDLPKIFETEVIDEVFFIMPRSLLVQIEEALLYCEQVGKRVSLAVDLFSFKFAKTKQTGISDFPLLSFQSTPDKIWQLFLKRTLDIVISAAALIILSPFFLLITVLIKKTSDGPVFFRQKRCGLNGRVFTLYKFRTMVQHAEKMLDSLKKHNEMSGPAFKMSKDPRVTPLGQWFRRMSIDELPQFVHVLFGDMSIVGPRPPIPSEVAHYQTWQRRRLSMRPGLTCLWQIKGRNKIVNFDEWMRLDLQYIDEWSLWLDFKIFLKTIPVVLFGIGAK